MSTDPVIWCDGALIPSSEFGISPFDLGLTVGLGVFETMASYEGRVFAYGKHHSRLLQSAEIIGIDVPQRGVIEAAMTEVLMANDLASGRARVRLTLTGGVNPLAGGDKAGLAIITAVAADPAPGNTVARLAWVPQVLNERAAGSGVKSISYAEQVLALRHARLMGADEALLLNSRACLAEGSMSNVFLVKDGVVRTPSLASGCLPGVTRQLVIALCNELGLALEQCELGKQDVDDADEIFLTSSVREIQGGCLLGAGPPVVGDVTKQLAQAYGQLVRKETG